VTSPLTADQVAALRALLAAHDAGVGYEGPLATNRSSAETHPALSDSRREETDDGTTQGAVMCRISKPYPNRTKWRVRVTDTETGDAKNYIYATEAEAIAARPKLLREYQRPVGVPMPDALDAYEKHLKTKGNVPSRGPNKPRTVETTMQRLRSVFVTDIITGDLTASKMLQLWEAWVDGKAVDTALNVLAQTRTFLAWLEKQGWTKGTPVTKAIEVSGKRKKGKPKLTQDEASKLLAWCLAQENDEGAVATAMAFLLGTRASEIVTRTVRHLDGKGTLLEITDAKTEAGERTLKLPAALQPLLAKLAKGKQADDRLFGDNTRHWVFRSVRRCCEAAGVRVVSPHGLRGTHAKMAREVGVSGVLLARAMGHESETTTTEHYAGRAAVANAAIDRVAELVH
jgi:integrase